MSPDTLVEALTSAAGGREITLSLSRAGEETLHVLGSEWLASVVRSVDLVYPDQIIDLVLGRESAEPMAPGSRIAPGLPGDTFTREGGMGVLTVAGDPRLPRISRRVSIPSTELLEGRTTFGFVEGRQGLRRRVGEIYGQVYRRAPLMLDRYKQFRTSRQHWLDGTAARGADRMHHVAGSDVTPVDQPPAAWFALHWLEAGGAESWAFESAELARSAGLDVVITVDRSAPQRMLDRALSITPSVYLGANVFAPEDWSRFGRMLLERHAVKVVHIHHSAMAYQQLPRLRHLVPGLKVVDSTHIAEHRTGGFVRQSLEHSDLIDVHHVISPALRDTYVLRAGVPAERVVYRPLTGLEGQDAPPAPRTARTARTASDPLRIGFLGRLAPQKRPFLFVELAHRLNRSAPGRFRFVMQGSGPLEDLVGAQIAKRRLGGVVERRAWGPVSDLFDDIDVLAITSDNEGLTLTALEGDRHGVLILSADVGSQLTVVAPELLVPREPDGFLRRSASILTSLADDPDLGARLLAEQHALHERIRGLESASTYMSNYFAQILEESR